MAPRTREELVSLATMDPALAALLKSKPPLKPPELTEPHTTRRENRTSILKAKWSLRYIPGPISPVTEHDLKIPVRDGSEIIIRVYTPVAKKDGGSPLIVMYHEGGWGMGDLSDEEVNCRLFARDLGAVCVNVEYRLAPEHPFPTRINDAWDSLQWCAKHASELGAEPSRGFVVGGGSAGGNIAAVVAHMARDEQLEPPLTGQFVFNLLPLSILAKTFNLIGLNGNVSSSLFVPFRYGKEERGHRDLPPAYFQVCGLDPLRDEALIYERVLREEAGVRTRLDVYRGLGHYFWTNFPGLEMSKTFVEETVIGMK
ncbi:AB hydrolase superfamily protein B1A11.02 [Lachnellula suecica]|uniref:AB hydrolase superfamily protein B1A11.02 n=1 Tax=Lachnellula suecica TaxID=602035 RepID=A0A8T9BTK9_9HELO|nr:AB hydrolase superfamily protein B1A11.02 [Lachnellula suecica]